MWARSASRAGHFRLVGGGDGRGLAWPNLVARPLSLSPLAGGRTWPSSERRSCGCGRGGLHGLEVCRRGGDGCRVRRPCGGAGRDAGAARSQEAGQNRPQRCSSAAGASGARRVAGKLDPTARSAGVARAGSALQELAGPANAVGAAHSCRVVPPGCACARRRDPHRQDPGLANRSRPGGQPGGPSADRCGISDDHGDRERTASAATGPDPIRYAPTGVSGVGSKPLRSRWPGRGHDLVWATAGDSRDPCK